MDGCRVVDAWETHVTSGLADLQVGAMRCREIMVGDRTPPHQPEDGIRTRHQTPTQTQNQ
jgi:hypothetical protein